jgi:hypothetical protein
MSEFLEVRCGRHRFLVPSADVDSIEVVECRLAPFAGRRAGRALMMLDGRALAGNCAAQEFTHGVALRAAGRDGIETRIVVDQIGALISCEAGAIERLPRAVPALHRFFSGVWRDAAAQQYLLCLRPHDELPLKSYGWLRLIRRAALTPPPAMSDREAVP